MAVQQFSTEIPQRLALEVAIPPRLSTESIQQTCDMVSSRLRFLLSAEYKRRSATRLRARLDARAARKAARLDAAAQAAEAQEALAVAAKRETSRAAT